MWIQTYGGHIFDYVLPYTAELNYKSLIYPLAHIPRFLGHTTRFYSVAQHSVHVSQLIEEPYTALCGLFHDVHEAYIGDLPRPLGMAFPDFFVFEKEIAIAVRRKLGLAEQMPEAVDRADQIMLVNEAKQLLGTAPCQDWTKQYRVEQVVDIPEWDIPEVRAQFTQRLEELLAQLPALPFSAIARCIR